MNKNDKNNKLDILSKILLVIIILSFVFSAVALGRSCTVNTASADVVQSETYTVFTLVEPDSITGSTQTYNAFDTSLYYAISIDNTSAYLIFEFQWGYAYFIVSNVTDISCHIRIYEDNYGTTYFDADYFYIVDEFIVFSLSSFSNDLSSQSSINCFVPVLDFELYTYTVSYEPVDPDDPDDPDDPLPVLPVDFSNQFDVFNGATVTYTIKHTRSPYDEFYSVTVPLIVYPNSPYISLENLYNILPQSVLNLDFNGSTPDNGALYEYVEDFYITLDIGKTLDVHLLSITGLDLSQNGVSLTFSTPDTLQGTLRGVLSNYGFISLNDFSDYTWDIVSFKFGYSFYSIQNNQYVLYTPYRDYLKSFKLVYGDMYSQGFTAGVDYTETQYGDTLQSVAREEFERGRIVGAAEANEYTFFGLISAVVDAPIQAVTGLLNFEFLGINLFAFFTGLLTVALILFIIKKIMGG